MVKVVHKKSGMAYDFYVGRPSLFGNPYTHLSGKTAAKFKVNTRKQAIQAFERYAWERMHYDADFRDALLSCEGKTVACWCKPKSCHGDCFTYLISRWREEQELLAKVCGDAQKTKKFFGSGQGTLWT